MNPKHDTKATDAAEKVFESTSQMTNKMASMATQSAKLNKIAP